MDLQQVLSSLEKADAAGDTQAAQALADLARSLMAAPQPVAPVAKPAGFSLKDLGTSFGLGAIGSTKSITDVAGAGNAASEYLDTASKSLQSQYTPERQAEMERQQQRMKQAEESGSTLQEVKAGLQNIYEAPLQSVAQGVGSFVPYIPAMFAGPVGAALGLGKRAVAAADVAAKVYTRGVGTAQGLGSVKDAIYDAVYKAEIQDGTSEEEAKRKADEAQSYGGKNLAQIGLGGGLGYLASLGGTEAFLTKKGREKAGEKTLIPRVAHAVGEETITEGAQGGQERLASNIALQNTGRDVPTFQGVAGQFTQEGVIGGLTAGPVAAISGGKSKADIEQERLKKEKEQFDEQQKAFNAQQEKTKENLQVPQTLALPAPSKKIIPAKEEAGLTNPLGNITKEELGPEISGYLDQHRQQNNLAPLQSYSIEDVKDAMTQVNPEGEKGALDSILTAKTGFSGEEKYTPQDVVNAAVEKNVAHETVGFQDFLQRTTGERDLNTMSQPQLYSAFKALSDMKRESTNQQLVLPQGSNASRFTQDQYDKGRSYVTQQLASGEPLVASPTREALKGVTGLKTDRDVHTLLQSLIQNEDLNVAKAGSDYQITSATPVKDARAPLPKGYSIEEGTYAEGERPAGYEITPEGRGKPLTTVDLEEEVAPKIERLTGLRQQEAAKMLADVNRYSGVVKAGQTSLDGMEARGLTGTEGYAKEKANQARREDVLSRRIKTLMDRIEEMSAPLKSKPVGTKPVTTKKSTLTKDGKVLGTFPSRLDAEASMLAQLTDAELNTLATDTRFGGITDRAVQEQERRKAPPGMRVKGTEAGLAKAGVYTQSSPEMAELEKNLVAALSKFGLKDVALKVVRAISNNAAGSYEAKLIKIAFDVANPVRTMRHEAVHALKELGFFTKDQWRILENKAKNDWVQTYLASKRAVVDGKEMSRLDAYKKLGLSESEILEEAIADAFADFDVNKAPPGMMMALLNKLRNFFKAIRQVLTGAGFESAEDIFGKIETGKLESQMDKADKAGDTVEKKQEKYSLRSDRSNGSFAPDDKTISTRKPKSGKAPENYLTEKLNVGIGVVKEDAVLLKKHADLVRNDPMMGTFKSDSDEETLNHFIEALKDNLLHLWNSTPQKIRDRSRNWYKGANKIANNLADGADISERAASGVLAALSPQTPWDVNVSQAARVITIWKNHQNTVADSAMYDWFNSKIAILDKADIPSDAMIALRDAVKDKPFGQTHPDIQAWWLRAYDETHHSREYHLVAPEGESAGLMLKKNGEPANMPWGNTGNIDKALSILNDDSMSNISEQMGDAHKVRSFYNNIVEPDSKDEHVTIDTHAVAAARIEPLSGSAPEVLQAWGGKGSSDVHGQGGLYGEYAEAYRRAAQELDVLPREVQSVTWEKIRGFFPDTFKTEKATKHVKSIWQQYQQGTITAKQVREQITKYSPNENPNWHGVSKPSAGEAQSTPNEVEPTSGAVGSGQATEGKRRDTKLSLRKAPDTPEFKRWFGDSKVVDADGKPLVVYHGTRAEITTFDSSEWDERDAGFWFGSSQDANNYAASSRGGGNVMPVYLSIKNPKIYYNRDVKITRDLIKKLKDDDYDGVMRDFANGPDAWRYGEDAKPEWAVFEPTQIKSATGNTGTYDSANPDIRYSLRDATDMFDPDEVKKSGETGYKSRYKLINISIEDFLRLAKFGKNNSKLSEATSRVKEGVKFTSIPYLYMDREGDNLRVTGHEGRHRAMALQQAGYNTMPVEIRSDIRWSEQTDPERFDYETNWPERIYAQEGAFNENFSIAMPFTREQAPENYQVLQEQAPKFSLRDIKSEIESMPNGKQIFSAIKGATTTREEKGWAERITSFVAPESFSRFRAQALDRYNQLSVREKNRAQDNGGIERLADSNAHAAALMSDLHAGVTAQALGVDDGVGGVPVYDKGYTSVSNLNGTVKGPLEIFKRLAAVGDPTIYQAYQFWAAAKRGKRLLGEGREENIDANGIGFAQALEGKYPMFVDIQKDWIKFNNGLVKYQIDTGVISKEMGAEWMKYADYIPFYRQLDGENTVGPKIYQSISGVKPTKKLKGSEAPLADFLETIVRNTHAAVQAGMKNVAAQRAGQLAVDVGIGERLDGPATGHDIITALENGKQVFYRIGDDLFVDAVSSLNIPELPFISFLTAPSNLLRNLVTKDPGFMLTNLMRDSVAAYVTSGANMKPMIDTVQEFTKAARGKSPEFEMLKRAGVVGGYDYSKGVQASTKNFAKQLRKRSGTQTTTEKRLKPVTGIWDFLEKGSEASDAATRIAVFKDTLKRTGNEAEALLQSLEVMNFNRKGSSALVRIVTAGVPFLNARIQGLDVLYRAGIRPIFSGTNPTEREKQIQRTFFVRAGMIMGISLMYAAAVKDEPEYEAQEEETKDNNWLIPQLGIRLPTPFEIGFLFKTMPERIYRWAFSGSDTAEEFSDSMKRGLVSTFAFNPVPQVALPLAEAVANYSTFTMRPIVGQNLLSLDPSYQVGPSTSVMAEKLGKQLGVSPMKIDHIYKGYTGTMGMYLVDTLDTVFDLFSDNPRPAKRFEQTPVLKRFLLDPEARGNVTAYYAFKHAVDEAVRTTNMLDKRLSEDASDYQEKKMGVLQFKKYVAGMDKQMTKLQDQANMIRSSNMPADEKRDALLEITQIQNEMTKDIRQIKKMSKET